MDDLRFIINVSKVIRDFVIIYGFAGIDKQFEGIYYNYEVIRLIIQSERKSRSRRSST